MTQAVATTQEKPKKPEAVMREQLTQMESQIGMALPAHIPVERFIRVVLTAVNGNPDLLNADRKSLFAAAMKAAQDGLLPDGRDGALVVYKTKDKSSGSFVAMVQWMPMISGVLKKVRNSGDLASIAAYVVYENDEFTYVLGDEERIEHRPALSDRGKPRLAYAIAKTKDGGVYREVMTVDEIEKVRSVSRAKDNGPWVQWWGEMARKTVLRRLAKRLPMSSDLDDLIRRDDSLYDFDSAREVQRPALAGLRARLTGQTGAGFNHAQIERETQRADVVEDAEISDTPQEAQRAPETGEDDFPGDDTREPDKAAPEPDMADDDASGDTDDLNEAYERGYQAAMKGRVCRVPEELSKAEGEAYRQGHAEGVKAKTEGVE